MKKALSAIAVTLLVPTLEAAIAPYSNSFSGTGSNTAFPAETADTEWTVASGVYAFNLTNTTLTPATASLPITNMGSDGFTIQTQFTITSFGSINSNGATVGLGSFGASTGFGGGSTSAYYLADWNVAHSSAASGTLRILALGDTSGFTGANVTIDDDNTAAARTAQLNKTYTLKLTGAYVGSTLNMTLGLFDATGTTQIGALATASDTSPLTGTNFGYRNRVGVGGGTFSASFGNYSVSIPEPASFVLTLSGAAFVMAGRRRRA